MINRRSLAVCLGAAMVLAGCSSGSGSDSNSNSESGVKNRITVGITSGADLLNLHVGIAQGLFAERGVDVDVVPLENAGTQMSAIANGSVDSIMQAVPVFATANQGGGDLQYFCGQASSLIVSVLARTQDGLPVASEDGFETAARAWESKSIGVPALGGAVEMQLRGAMSAVGADQETVQFVAVGVAEQAQSALEQSHVDLLGTFPFYVQMAEVTGGIEPVASLGTDAPDDFAQQMSGGWMASKTWLEENAETAENFCTALGAAMEFSVDPANADAVAAVIKDRYGIGDPTVIERILQPDGPLTKFSSDLECSNFTAALDAAIKAGVIENGSDMNCANSIWEA